MILHLNKIESPLPKDALCQDWLNLAEMFWRRRFFYCVNVVLLFLYYFPLEKGVAPHLNKLKFPSPKDALCMHLFGRNWLCGFREKDFKFRQCIFDI